MPTTTPAGDHTEDRDDEGGGVPSIDVHQPGHSAEATLPPRDVHGDPPDAVGAADDKGGGPEDRAPDPPEG